MFPVTGLKSTSLVLGSRTLRQSLAVPSKTAVRSFVKVTAPKQSSALESLLGADQNIAQNKLFHKTNYAAIALTPIALMLPSTGLSVPVDVALAILFPLHGHIGMNWVFTDYVPGSPTGPARMALLACSALATLGLLKLAVSGDGLTGSTLAVWRGKEEK